MKKIAFLILAVTLIFMGCTKNEDFPMGNDEELQLKSADNGNYTEQFYFNPGPLDYFLDVMCEGQSVDNLKGDGISLTVHALLHFKNGEMQWGKWLVKGKLTSQTTGETFIIHETNKGDFEKENGAYYLITHTNAIGDNGTHYLFSGKFIFPEDMNDPNWIENGTWEWFDARCVPEKKDK